MSLRDWFAGMVMPCATGMSVAEWVESAYSIADAMIAERDRKPEPPEFPFYHDAQGNEPAEY